MSRRGDFGFRAPAHHVELALQFVLASRSVRRRAETPARYKAASRAPARPMASPSIGVSRQPSTVKPFFAGDAFDDAFAQSAAAAAPPAGTSCPRRSSPGSGSENPSSRAFPREEFVRDLNQDAGAVAGFRIAAAGAAVRQIDQDLDALADDFVRFLPIEIDHKTHPAGVVFVAGIVKPLRRPGGGYDMLQNTLSRTITSTGFISLQY